MVIGKTDQVASCAVLTTNGISLSHGDLRETFNNDLTPSENIYNLCKKTVV